MEGIGTREQQFKERLGRDTYRLLAVYTTVVCRESKELLAGETDAGREHLVRLVESAHDLLLLFCRKLRPR